MAAHLNATPKYVATRTLVDAELTWTNARVLEGALGPTLRGVKAEGHGDIVVLGSGVLVQELIAEDLVDGFRLFLHPLLLGGGKRLFRPLEHPRRLHLQSVEQTSTGVVMLSYDTEDTP